MNLKVYSEKLLRKLSYEFFADVDAGKKVREEVKQKLIASQEAYSVSQSIEVYLKTSPPTSY